jgi:hypothetical protein
MTDCEDCLEYKFLTVLKQNAEYLKSIAESLKILAEKPPITIQIRSPVGVEIATEEGGQ